MQKKSPLILTALAASILLIINVSTPRGQPALAEETRDPVEPLIKILKEHSLYPLNEQTIKAFERCVRKKAFLKIDLPKGHILAEDLKVETCFPQDPYARYEKKPQDADPKTLVKDLIMTSAFAYIKVESFGSTGVAQEIRTRLQKLVKSKTNGLLLDLRGNTGGLVNEAVETVKLFAPRKDMLIVEWTRRDGGKFSYKTDDRGPYADLPMVILVDNYTASAAEIAAGILQIWGYQVIGTKTFGKAVGQERQIFGEDLFSFTTARYFFPNGESPDNKGITPDILEEDEQLQVKVAKELLLKTAKSVKSP